jgi:chorismate dehydratase
LLHWGLTTANRPRVCAVSFLNTVPLVWGMLHGEQRGLFDVSFAVPADCADRLRDGRADIGIVPVAELLTQKLDILPGCGIACDGPVRSILLFSKVPFPQIRTLAVDSSSRTSVLLSRLILSKKFGVEPDLIRHRPDLGAMLDRCDAALIIGDPALLIDPELLPYRWLDLGGEWTAMTGLPMVFAVWAARTDAPTHDPSPFIASLRFGQAHLDDIVRLYHEKTGISAELARVYLADHIVFDLGERERAGMSLFLKYAQELQQQAEMSDVTV